MTDPANQDRRIPVARRLPPFSAEDDDAADSSVSPNGARDTDGDPSPEGTQAPSRGLPMVDRRPGALVPTAQYPVIAPPTHLAAASPIIIDPRVLPPAATPRAMQWSLAQLIQVLLAMAVVVGVGVALGWMRGGDVEPTYAARSEFIYFLDDAVPDGFLREDRRILTQLVTLESEAVVGPIAEQFDTTTEELRRSISVGVVDLSEVVRLDVEDPDGERALAINQSLLAQYTVLSEISDRREEPEPLAERRSEVLAELDLADQEVAVVAEAELADVTLELQEESLTRELDAAATRVDRLSAISDGLLTETTPVDDTASLESQLQVSRQRLPELEAELLTIRTERSALQRSIERQLASEVPSSATANQEREVTLSVREDSVQLEIDTVAERIVRLEALAAESLLDNPVAPSGEQVEVELAESTQLVGDLEDQLLVVRLRRAELEQSAATRPSLTRRIERLEQDLAVLDNQIAVASLTSELPSPIEILTAPVILDEPVGNPRLRWAALGFLASLPIAVAIGALVRHRQRRRMS